MKSNIKDLLKEIVDVKRKEIEALKSKTPLTHFVDSRRLLKGARSFRDALFSDKGKMGLIAEIKKKSPSRKKGFSCKMDKKEIACIYEENGAGAISVLTDKKFFGGNISHIEEIKKTVSLPVLRKDFIIDEYQIYESRYFGADALLLIARILTKEQIKGFMNLAKRIGMDSLVEIHDEKDLEKALFAGAKIIGINNRDLDTFKVDINNTIRLSSKMPREIFKISESGIRNSKDILRLRDSGIRAVLIGETFLNAHDIGSKVREITGRVNS